METARTISPGIKLGTHVAAAASNAELSFLVQLGIRHVRVHLEEGDERPAALRRIRQRFEAAGLDIFAVVHPAYKAPEIALGLDGRDEKIERFASVIRAAGEAGLHTIDYDFFLFAPLPATGTGATRGALTRVFDLNAVDPLKPAFDRRYSREEIWDNYTHFIRRIAPVAEEAGVRLALHPDDPPVPTLHGVDRIFCSLDDLVRAVDLADSPSCGILLCVGTWAEGGSRMGTDVCDAIRIFAERGRLFNVHLRNVSGPLPCFSETFLDNGYVDMGRVMQALTDIDFDGMVIPDHVPQFEGDAGQHAALAYSTGMLRALLMSAQRGPRPSG